MYLAAQLGVEGPLPWHLHLVNALKYWCFSRLLLEPSLQAVSLRDEHSGESTNAFPPVHVHPTLHHFLRWAPASPTRETLCGQKRCSTTKDESVSSCLCLCSCCSSQRDCFFGSHFSAQVLARTAKYLSRAFCTETKASKVA